MKKHFLIFSISFLFLLTLLAFSQQKTSTLLPSSSSQKCLIGIIDLQKAIINHPKAKESMETLKNFQEERQKDLDSKTKGKELTDEERKQITELVSKYEEEIQELDRKLTEKLLEDVKTAAEKVAKKKGLIIVIEKEAVFYGGVDITEEVIQEMQK